MRSFNSFADHVSSLPANAIKAATHGLLSPVLALVGGKTASVPSEFLVSDPSLFSGSRRHPNSGHAVGVNNRKGPLGFKVNDFAVANDLGSDGVYNFNKFGTDYKFGFNPKSVNNPAEDCTNSQLNNGLYCVCTYQDAICTKKNYQYIRTAGPREIAFGAKGFIHNPSIAGETK